MKFEFNFWGALLWQPMKKRKVVEQSAFYTTLPACQICFISFLDEKKKWKKRKIKKRKISWTRAKVAACKVLRFPMGEIPYPAKLAFLFVSRQAQNPKWTIWEVKSFVARLIYLGVCGVMFKFLRLKDLKPGRPFLRTIVEITAWS